MSNLVGAMQRRLDHVLAQACYRLVAVQRRRCIVIDSQSSLAMVPKLLMDASSGLMLTLQSLDVSVHTVGSQACGHKQDLGPNLGCGYSDHVLAQACEGRVAVRRRSCRTQVVRAFFLDSSGMVVTRASQMPGSRWGWSEYGVVTRTRVISPSPERQPLVISSS